MYSLYPVKELRGVLIVYLISTLFGDETVRTQPINFEQPYQKKSAQFDQVRLPVNLIVVLILSTLLLPLMTLAGDNDLFRGQILHIACNGDVTDQSGQNHPVENEGVTIVSDKISKRGRACFFAGNDYLRISNSPSFSLSNFTISAWALVEAEVAKYNGEARAIVSNYDESAPYYGIGIYSGQYQGKAVTFFDDGTGLNGAIDTNGSSLADAQWHHVTAVFKGGVNVELYVDGVSKSRSSGTMPAIISPTGDLFIGRDGNSENLLKNKWVGSLDDIRIFNRALSAEEVTRLAGVIDLPTGETFIPLGTGENDPYLLEVEEGPLTSVMVTPNPAGGVSLNRVPSAGLRAGERNLPPETSTLVLNGGKITYLDENLPGVVATMNLAGDLEITDENIPDLKAILPRLEDRFLFVLLSDPSVKIKVNHDGTLEISDDNQPHLAINRDNDGNYMIVDNNTNAVVLADRNGDAVLSHPDMPGIVATFNLFDSGGQYSLVDTATNECIENISSRTRGLFDSIKSIGSATLDKVKDTVTSTVGTFASDTTQKLLSGVASGATALAGSAAKAAGGISAWWACAPALAKFAVVGGAVAAVAAVGVGIYLFFKQRKEIKKLRQEVQKLQAVVQIQAKKIAELEATVANQAQRIQQLEAIVAEQAEKIDQQAKAIAALEDENAKIQEQLDKQAEVNDALLDRIADLEERLKKAEEGSAAIPPGEPTTPSSVKKAASPRKNEATACIKVPGVNLQYTVARTCQSQVVKVEWVTLAELGNTGFNVYRAQKDADGEFINIIKLNDVLIPSQGNGVGENTYLLNDSTQRLNEAYYYGIESVDTEGETFLFDDKLVKADECVLATLGDFEAEPANDSIFLEWETLVELNTKGFYTWRAKAPIDGQCLNKPVAAYQEVVRLSDRLISAKKSIYGKTFYSFADQSVNSQTTYCYGLEEVVDDGTSIFHWDEIIAATAR